MRDEAHRFAIEFHRRVRGKEMRESALDGVRGVGEAKKRLLLTAFGSLEALAAASVEEIAAVPGIGVKLARTVKEALA